MTQRVELCKVSDIPDDDSRGFNVAGHLLFAVKKDGCIYVYLNRCPHLGINLEWNEHRFLDSEAALIQCSTHGALFLIDTGDCVAGPCLGKALTTVVHEIVGDTVMIEPPAENAALT